MHYMSYLRSILSGLQLLQNFHPQTLPTPTSGNEMEHGLGKEKAGAFVGYYEGHPKTEEEKPRNARDPYYLYHKLFHYYEAYLRKIWLV